MDVQLAFDFWGAEAPETKAAAESDRSQDLRFEGIAKMIADRRAPVWAISRKIAGEMANTIKQMKTPVRPFECRRTRLGVTDRIKALRELQRTLLESEGFSKEDRLDLDGPKFKFVFGEIVRLFEQALKDAGADRFQVETIMVRVANLLEENDGTLRRNLDRIGTPEMEANDMGLLLPVSLSVDGSAASRRQSA